MAPHFIDAHLHLQDRRFSGYLDQIIENGEKAGVNLLFCNATSESDWSRVIDIGNHNKSVVPFLGIHPWNARETVPGWKERLQDVLQNYNQPAGIGESGLDRMCNTDFSRQVNLLEAHLETAHLLLRPIALHCIRSWGTLVDILESHASDNCLAPVMIHSFSGSYETMKRLTDIGCFISYSTSVADPRQKKLTEVFKQTPVENLLFETDAPDQHNQHLSDGQTTISAYNEPVLIPLLYQWAAKQKNIELTDLILQIEHNAKIFTNQTAGG